MLQCNKRHKKQNQSTEIGIDLSEKAISFAKAFSNGYEFYCKDIFDVKEKFNTVCLIEVIEHIPDGELSSFIDESFKKVDVGGYLIISVPTTVDPVQKKHFRHYDESLLNKHINHKNFKIISGQFQVNFKYKKTTAPKILLNSLTISKWINHFLDSKRRIELKKSIQNLNNK